MTEMESAMSTDSAARAATQPEEPYERTQGPVHEWFGLTYANFAVQHRARLQSMPLEWQRRFVYLMEELAAAYDGQPDPEFEVKTVRWEYVEDLSSAELEQLSITRGDDEAGDDEDRGAVSSPDEYYDRDGHALGPCARAAIPVPDPIPHYRHAYLPPDEAAIAARHAFMAADGQCAGGG
jgi:hypothetical protein